MALVVARRELEDSRSHAVGAVALRTDGAFVHARNGSSERVQPLVHAERRLLRKAGRGSIIYVARRRRDGRIGLARPCEWCLTAMRRRGVKRVYYTISDQEYGTYDFAV